MVNSSLHEVVTDQFRAVFMLGADDQVDAVENVDVEVYLPDGTQWIATFMTIREIERVMDRWRSTGENQNGAYFRCADLVVMRDAGVPAMIEVLRSVISRGELSGVMTNLS